MTNKKQPAFPKKADENRTLQVVMDEGKSHGQQVAKFAMSCQVANASTVSLFSKGTFGEIGIGDAVGEMRERTKKVLSGDIGGLEETLTAQAIALNAMFNELARRAALNMGDHLTATETYLRMALKAQSQCRTTIETLGELKYPKQATFIRQANIANQQQVNNGVNDLDSSTRTGTGGKNINPPNELLTKEPHETLDSSRKGETIRANPHMETVGAVNRS